MREAIEALIVMISPFAPHTAEELWEMTGHAGGIEKTRWPSFDEERRQGRRDRRRRAGERKSAGRLTVAAETPESELRERALADPGVRPHIDGKDDQVGGRREGETDQCGCRVGGRCSCGFWRRRSPRTGAGMRWRAAATSCPGISRRSGFRTSRITRRSSRWRSSSPIRCARSSSAAATTRLCLKPRAPTPFSSAPSPTC